MLHKCKIKQNKKRKAKEKTTEKKLQFGLILYIIKEPNKTKKKKKKAYTCKNSHTKKGIWLYVDNILTKQKHKKYKQKSLHFQSALMLYNKVE